MSEEVPVSDVSDVSEEVSKTGTGAARAGRAGAAGGRSLAGRAALVTGATSGVGRAVGRALAAAGADLWAVGRNEEALEAARRWDRDGASGTVRPLRADLADADRALEAAERVRGEADGLDVLVHSAGVYRDGELEELALEDHDDLFDLHVRARSLITRELLPQLRSAAGDVVFVNSSQGLGASAGTGMYAASMHALRAVADALRDEVNDDGIRVTTVYLGRTATPMQEEVHEREGRPYEPERLIRPESVARAVLGALTLPRDAEVTDIRLRSMREPAPRRGSA